MYGRYDVATSAGGLVLGLALVLQGIEAAQAANPAPAGRVEFAIGSPTAAGPDKRARPLARGASVFEGDLINTGAGRVQVRFTDGGFVSLQPQTQFKVEQYRYAGKQDGSEKGIFNLVKGGMRTITGLIGKNENKNYRVHTKVATIGVRGTEYSLSMDTALHGSVAHGQIDVCSAGGCAPFARGESFMVEHGAARPLMTLRKASLPAPQPAEQHQEPPPDDSKGSATQTTSAPPPGDSASSPTQTASTSPPEGAPPPGGVIPVASGPEGAPPPEGAPLVDPLATTLLQPPPAAPNPGFVQGDATDSAGTSSALKLTGPHFLAYALARYPGAPNGVGGLTSPTMGNVLLGTDGVAQTIGPFSIVDAKGGGNSYSSGGEGYLAGGSLAVHYALGYPTLPTDISALHVSSPLMVYTHLAGSPPSGYFGTTAPSKEEFIGKFLSGTLSVDLTAGLATAQVFLEFAGTSVPVIAAGMTITEGVMPTTPATTFAGFCTTGAGCQMRGFLVGPNARGAMAVYEFGGAFVGGNQVTARGMVAFQRP